MEIEIFFLNTQAERRNYERQRRLKRINILDGEKLSSYFFPFFFFFFILFLLGEIFRIKYFILSIQLNEMLKSYF